MRIGLLNNLRAGRSDSLVYRLLGLLSAHPDVLHVETDSAAAVPEALDFLARQEVDLLVVNGGDGTIQYTLTEVLEHRAFDDRVPMISVLRGGRTNMTASDIGAHRDPVHALARLIEAAKAGELESWQEPRPVLRVEYGRNRHVRNGMFMGGGTIYRAIDRIHASFPEAHGQGVAGSTAMAAGLISRIAFGRRDGIVSPDKAQVLVDGEAYGGEYFLLIASSLQRLFTGMRPFWGTGPGGVRFTAIKTNADRVWRAAPGILRGTPRSDTTPENGYMSWNAKRVELQMDSGFTIDGEQFAPEADRIVSISADSVVRFIRN